VIWAVIEGDGGRKGFEESHAPELDVVGSKYSETAQFAHMRDDRGRRGHKIGRGFNSKCLKIVGHIFWVSSKFEF
jgi:hypothetical protein